MSEKHPKKLLVSLQDRKSDYRTDAELPADMRISDLKEGILRMLKAFEYTRYGFGERLDLFCNDQTLEDSETLSSLGIWDGSKLQFRISAKGKF